jgi:hypothetical protein
VISGLFAACQEAATGFDLDLQDANQFHQAQITVGCFKKGRLAYIDGIIIVTR